MYSRAYVEITNVCNGNCSFCPGHTRKSRFMSEQEFDVVTDKLSGMTSYIYYHLMGEPTLHPRLGSLIRIASGKGFKSAITTNGTRLHECGDMLISSGVYKVNISLHSFEEDDEKSFEIYVSRCLDFADKASGIGVLTVFRLWNQGHDNGRNRKILDMMRARFPDCEWQMSSGGARIRHRLHLEYGERFAWPDMGADDMGDSVFCYGLSDHFGILSDGTVVPCCLDRNGELALGNAFVSDISELLNSARAVEMLKGFKCRHATEELCRKCGYARRFK